MEADKKDDGPPPGNPGTWPLYLSPYEYWNFLAGRGYAFPVMHQHLKYLTALGELSPTQSRGHAPPQAEEISAPDHRLPRRRWWIPTLWNNGDGLTFIPFITEFPLPEIKTPDDLRGALDRGLNSYLRFRLGAAAELVRDDYYPRFRVAYPVEDAAMHADLKEPSGAVKHEPYPPDWSPDPGLGGRIGEDKQITVIAIIDDGLAFAHRNFRDASGSKSRVEFCWLQSVEIEKNLDQPSVLFGREYTRGQIERLIGDYGDDEDVLYDVAGATADTDKYGSLLNRHATHGAHVMDLATGYAPERGEEPPEEIRIIAVQLPNMVTMDTSGFGKDMYIMSAFHYIFDRADLIAKGYKVDKLRLVINFSYGYSGGRHDGESEIEAAINQLIAKRRALRKPTALVVPAGNTFLDRMHGKIADSDFRDGALEIPWRIQPNGRTTTYLEIWFWQDFNPLGFTVELRDPFGRPVLMSDQLGVAQTSLPVGADLRARGDPERVFRLLNQDGHQVGQVSSDLNRPPPKPAVYSQGRWRVLTAIAPTEPNDQSLPGALPGKWTLVIRRGVSKRLENPIHFWIQRATDPEAFRSGARQSYFDDPRDQLYTGAGSADLPEDTDDPLYTGSGDLLEEDTPGALDHRFGSISGIATGKTSLVVGGYRLGDNLDLRLDDARPSRYSAAGSVDRGWPDAEVACSSMSDRSRLLIGTIAAGVRSGSLSVVQGTSSAAPFVARQLATIFATEKDDDCVAQAGDRNYLTLFPSDWSKNSQGGGTKLPGTGQPGAGRNIPIRLGTVRVPAHWQPGIIPPYPPGRARTRRV